MWFQQALARIPGSVLTDEEKQMNLSYFVESHRKKDGLMDRFDIIAKRARNAANRGNER